MKKNEILTQLHQLGSQERAVKDQRYHKSNRIHLGVPAAQVDELVRSITRGMPEDERIALAREMWETDLFDAMMLAGKILGLKSVPPSTSLWGEVCYFLRRVDGWALEDQLAHAAWKCLLADRALLDELDLWTTHPNFWMRRAALVYTLPFAKPGHDPERMLKWASSYACDPEWFIQKAIGWWLRVLGEHNPSRVIQFVNDHQEKLKGVAKREATRKLKEEWTG